MGMGALLLGSFFDLVLRPLQSFSPVWGVGIVALFVSIGILLVYRYTSNQERLKVTKDGIKAHILELWLFSDDLRTMFTAQGQILRLNGRYLSLMLKPLAVLIIPLVLTLLALEGWFGYRPLLPGETAIVSVYLEETAPGVLEHTALESQAGVVVETLPMRVPRDREVSWRIRADKPGVHTLAVDVSGHRVEKEVIVSPDLVRVSPSRFRSFVWQALLSPGEASLGEQSAAIQVDVHYPKRWLDVYYGEAHWLVVFFVLSLVFAFALKRPLGVEL